ncbi:probable WRKY transcription factor 53 [Pistacia vera]|uniref:probable WRKY transcription factor 53 n=1 Tax=Pistacia vera TaxID=55513 RepID=UPI001263AB87|nr:probable WRKY transcription factor 53 [Pistacia vera]
MENGFSWEQKTLTNELIEGMELAKQLRVHLGTTASTETNEELVRKILTSYEKALLILKWNGPTGQTPTAGAITAVPESPISINGSPQSDDLDGTFKDNQDQPDSLKKRKTTPRWTDKVRVSFESGLEGPHEDGYSWRKYGQKDILGARYPRSYYRCTYRNTQNCWATKQVQRSDEDPTIFEITYRGTHTCSHGNSVTQPASPEKKEQKLIRNNNNNNNNNNNRAQQQSQGILFNLREGLSINNNGLENKEIACPFSFPSTSYGCKSETPCYPPPMLDENNFLGGFSSSFGSHATGDSNYFLISPSQMNNFGDVHNMPRSESDLTELLSANNSAATSPILNLDFSLDPADIDPNFPFGNAGFSF